MLRTTFILEQHVGHRTYGENLRRFVAAEGSLEATWVPVPYAPAGRPWERLPLPGGLRGALRGRHEVLRGLAARPADAHFFLTQVPALLGGRAALRRPYFISTDITPAQYDAMGAHYGHRATGHPLLAAYKHRRNCAVLRGAARVFAWSAWARASLVGEYGVAAERVEVLPVGLDLERWAPGPPRDAAAPLRLLFVGGDFARKGGPELLEAFAALPAGSAELHLVTRAAPEPRPAVRVYADLRPNDPTLIALFRSCDLFVLPSRAEAFGIAAAEAQAAGLPAIVGNTGGLPETIDAGRSGLVVQPGDPAELAQCLARFVASPQLLAPMGRAARAWAEARFDGRRNAARIARCIGALAGAERHAQAALGQG